MFLKTQENKTNLLHFLGKCIRINHQLYHDLVSQAKELASAGIMRNYMTRPCGIYFTMDRKVRAFLENTFLLYEIPRAKIEEAIKFVSQFDYEALAKQVIDNMLAYLESKT